MFSTVTLQHWVRSNDGLYLKPPKGKILKTLVLGLSRQQHNTYGTEFLMKLDCLRVSINLKKLLKRFYLMKLSNH